MKDVPQEHLMHIEFEKIEYPPGTEVRDTPDPPPQETWHDACTGFINRWCEELLRYARFLGFL